MTLTKIGRGQLNPLRDKMTQGHREALYEAEEAVTGISRS